ncbi:MAG: 30S ribosomal protein S1 [Anaerolineae bacterium]
MFEPGKDRAPWEIPPDEGYWRALLEEGEYVEPAAAPDIAEAIAVPRETVQSRSDVPLRSDAPLRFDAPPPGTDLATIQRDTLTLGPQAAQEAVELQPAEAAYESKATPQPQAVDEELNWERFQACQENDDEIELPVIGYNRGGLLVKWSEVVGFVPASQLCDVIVSGDESARQEALSEQVGRTLTLKVIEVDPGRKRLILSERAARRVQEPDLSILDGLLPGDVCRGTVTNLCSFGVFVDLGGIEGLIHISELSWGRVTHPSDVLQSGEDVDVYVLNVDPERGRIGLSLKRLYPDPWETADGKYGIGEIFEGKITNIVNFGAFVRLEEGLEGLIHNSEWGDSASQQHVREGDLVQVRVISLDSERHRMGLSLENIPGDEPPLVSI